MVELKQIQKIHVPPPRADETYETSFLGQKIAFLGLKQLLGAADISKAGDRRARLATTSEIHREAARELLSGLTLEHLYHRPLTDDRGEIDAVMRVSYDIDLDLFGVFERYTLGELKDHLLRAPPPEVARAGRALTAVMASALAKLCDVHELILIASKISRPTRARTRLGLPGTLSSRLQPNHPTDDPRGISLLVYWGLSIGAGDALLGVNPAVDTVENVSAILRLLDDLRKKTGAPTQICALGHIKTQLQCLEQGAPVEILFQSLAGTEACNLTEFDITIDLLDHGYRSMAERGALAGEAEQFMYFETGQGSEVSYGKHQGIDMTTAEALCYTLARRYDPFMVNNVTGFIGPETHRDGFEMVLSNLQDHFMGKLLGLPMGMAPCYTLHAEASLLSQQMATQMLTAAGAGYYMDVCLNTDRMLAYFDTSGHDVQTLREIHGKRPSPELCAWAIEQGIFEEAGGGALRRGPHWGDVARLAGSEAEVRRLLEKTPPPHGFGTAGPRPDNATSRALLLNQAAAREAVRAELDVPGLSSAFSLRVIETQATTKDEHLAVPEKGARLSEESKSRLCPEDRAVQVLISDGLSAEAVHYNIRDLLPVVLEGLAARGVSVGQPVVARYGRVKLAEDVAERLGASLVVCLLGERPGGDALSSRSLSAYLVYRLADAEAQARAARESHNAGIHYEYSVLSNIYEKGLPPVEAGAVIVERALSILTHKAAGNRLEGMLARESARESARGGPR
jgi:ethanolamine ammonia-lyase large subunit